MPLPDVVSGLLLSPRSPVRARAGVPTSKQHHKVISRRRRRPIDRWCCFSFPNRTHFIGLRFGSYQGANTVPFPPCGENCTMLAPSSFPNRTHSVGLRFGCLRSSAAAGGVRSTDGVVFPFQIEPISLGFDLVPIKEQTPFRFRFTAKTALCWLLLPFPNRTRSAGLQFTFFTTRRASTICACPPSHILSVSHFYFLKNATTTAPGPAWVPITLPTVV